MEELFKEERYDEDLSIIADEKVGTPYTDILL